MAKRKTKRISKKILFSANSLVKNPKKLVFLGLIFIFLSIFFFIFSDLPSPTRLSSWHYPVSTKIFDREGNLLYEIYAQQNRSPISLEELPSFVAEATISSEDKNFYHHHGFSWRGIVRAAFNTLFRRKLQGGSTITQQLVKNALLTPERTLRRKIREFVLTLAVELIYKKDQILQMYLNHAPYGGTAWGIEAAAKTYFGKQAKDLTLAEAALLAGLPASPTRYSPFGAHPELAKARQEWVLDQMVENGYLKKEEAEKAKKEKLSFTPQKKGIKAPHFVMYVKDKLVEEFGEKRVEQGGLRVTTTLDLEIQEFAEETVAEEIEKVEKYQIKNGAVLVTNPKTGEILSMVGSKDYFDQENQGNFNVTTAQRQPGSAIKPLNYALAFEEKKITPATVINDLPTCFRVVGQPLYCPTNYDFTFHGPVQARFALGNSYNIPAVKVLTINSLASFVPFAQKMGLTTLKDPSSYGPSLTLGGGEVKMVDMAVAFGTLANLGVKQKLISILKVEDYQGKLLKEAKIKEGERVLSMETAYLVSHILLDNNARQAAFGSSSYLVIPSHPEVSVKTGTTNDRRDNWTIGYTPSFVVVCWVGNNDNSPMSYVASGLTGASPIWNKITSFVLKRKDLEFFAQKEKVKPEELKEEKVPSFQEWLPKPEGIVGTSICALSGKLPGDSNCPTRFEYFLKGTVPTETENLKESVLINKDTGQPVQPGERSENVEFQEHQIIKDFLGTIFCLDCPPKIDSSGQAVKPNPAIINFASP